MTEENVLGRDMTRLDRIVYGTTRRLIIIFGTVLFRVKVMELPRNDAARAALNQRLLEMNATDLVHGSYGISESAIVLTEALELAHLDFEEFLASYESMTVSLATQLRELTSYREDR